VLVVLGFFQILPLPRSTLDVLSSGTARLCKLLLPLQPEQLASTGQFVSPPLAAGSRISLYPGITCDQSIRLIAVLCLFIVVRFSVASFSAWRRLSIAALVNGGCLSYDANAMAARWQSK